MLPSGWPKTPSENSAETRHSSQSLAATNEHHTLANWDPKKEGLASKPTQNLLRSLRPPLGQLKSCIYTIHSCCPCMSAATRNSSGGWALPVHVKIRGVEVRVCLRAPTNHQRQMGGTATRAHLQGRASGPGSPCPCSSAACMTLTARTRL